MMKYTKFIGLNLKESEYFKLQRLVRESGTNQSDVLRELLNKAEQPKHDKADQEVKPNENKEKPS